MPAVMVCIPSIDVTGVTRQVMRGPILSHISLSNQQSCWSRTLHCGIATAASCRSTH